jgi:hypothetical protein
MGNFPLARADMMFLQTFSVGRSLARLARLTTGADYVSFRLEAQAEAEI